jgi:ribosomal protein S18 acetylase RimI-like enzyme
VIRRQELLERSQQLITNSDLDSMRIRSAVSEDSDDIARVFLESAEHHTELDPELYFVPDSAVIAERYKAGRQHPPSAEGESTTFVAEFDGEVVGFIDARLDRSPDAMHRAVVFCHIAEIAVCRQFQRRGIGARLLQAAERWGSERGADIALLEYHSANSQPREFYRSRMGYRVTSISAVKSL